MTNDVSAVADPQTGVAVYDTFCRAAGWCVGGTSVATPIIASTYALAGTPEPGTNPASYPYLHTSGLNDVTSGTNYNQSCTPAYFCTAGPGYDGPTGWHPRRDGGVRPVKTGTVSGTATDACHRQAGRGATVTVGGFSTVTTACLRPATDSSSAPGMLRGDRAGVRVRRRRPSPECR